MKSQLTSPKLMGVKVIRTVAYARLETISMSCSKSQAGFLYTTWSWTQNTSIEGIELNKLHNSGMYLSLKFPGLI